MQIELLDLIDAKIHYFLKSKVLQRSVELFNSGFCCAESVLLSVSESKGIESDLIPKIATGFCGGISHTDGICGAISGGILAINMIYGRSKPSDPREDSEVKVQDLISTFKENFHSTHCYKLTGCDLGTEEGQEKYNINECYELCDKFVFEATKLTLDLIED